MEVDSMQKPYLRWDTEAFMPYKNVNEGMPY